MRSSDERPVCAAIEGNDVPLGVMPFSLVILSRVKATLSRSQNLLEAAILEFVGL